jgi:hypothetical protein
MSGMFQSILDVLDGIYQISAVTMSRPANLPGAYGANDEINTSTSVASYLTFTDVVRVAGGKGMITMARLSSNSSAMTSQLRLHLYNSPPTACVDHAAFIQLWADDTNYIGYIDFGYRQFAGAGSDMVQNQVSAINMMFECEAGSKNLYGRTEVVTAGAAPTSAQQFRYELKSLVN